MDFFQKIINEYEQVDTLEEIDELFQSIKDDEELLKEINLDDIFNCSFPIRLEGLPTPVGTNFFSIYDPLQAINVIIPDLFKLCSIKNPKFFQHPLFSSRIMPKNKIKFPDEFAIGASIFTRLQTLLPIEIIKSFLYFGYKSNFELMKLEDIGSIESKIKNIISVSSANFANYTDPEIIFNKIYDKNTLIQSILELNNLLEKVKEEKNDLTNIGNYQINYLISTYAIGFIQKVPFDLLKDLDVYRYSNEIDKITYGLSYTDLVYLNYLKKIAGDNNSLQNFLLLLQNDQLGTEVSPEVIDNFSKIINFVNKNNIYIVINLALEIKSYVLQIISYNLNQKVYKPASFTNINMIALTKNLYCNYAKNTSYNYPFMTPPNWCL